MQREHIWKDIVPLPSLQYERCSLLSSNDPNEPPHYLFQIETEHGEGGPVLISVQLVLIPDEGFWRFALDHPQWRMDVRPLLLMLVQDIFWKFKLLDCSNDGVEIRGRNHDPKQNGGIEFLLLAKRYCQGDDSTLINLANYTNTHVIDQLHEVYAQNPDVKWTEERAAAIKADFYRSLAEKKLRSTEHQVLRLKGWRRSGLKECFFIDESGDLGFRDLNSYFLYSACGTEASSAASMSRALREIVESEWGNTKPDELHFTKIPEAKRAGIFKKAVDCFEAHGGRAICYAMLKRELLKYFLRCEAETRRLEEQPIITNLFDLFAKPENNPGAYFLSLCAQEMCVFLGTQSMLSGHDFEIVHDRKHRSWMNQALTKGFERAQDDLKAISNDVFGDTVTIASSFRLEDSKHEPCLWISDWIAWEVGRWLRGEELSDAMKRALESVRLITFNQYGQKVESVGLGGEIIAEFPDWPRRWVPESAV